MSSSAANTTQRLKTYRNEHTRRARPESTGFSKTNWLFFGATIRGDPQKTCINLLFPQFQKCVIFSKTNTSLCSALSRFLPDRKQRHCHLDYCPVELIHTEGWSTRRKLKASNDSMGTQCLRSGKTRTHIELETMVQVQVSNPCSCIIKMGQTSSSNHALEESARELGCERCG